MNDFLNNGNIHLRVGAGEKINAIYKMKPTRFMDGMHEQKVANGGRRKRKDEKNAKKREREGERMRQRSGSIRLPEIDPESDEREGINCTHTSFKNRLH